MFHLGLTLVPSYAARGVLENDRYGVLRTENTLTVRGRAGFLS